jgi:hypothetical protein
MDYRNIRPAGNSVSIRLQNRRLSATLNHPKEIKTVSGTVFIFLNCCFYRVKLDYYASKSPAIQLFETRKYRIYCGKSRFFSQRIEEIKTVPDTVFISWTFAFSPLIVPFAAWSS